MKRGLATASVALLLLAGVLVLRALQLPSRQPAVAPVPERVADVDAAAGRLAGALRFPTVSHEDPAEDDRAPFVALRAYLESAFPLVHQRLQREVLEESLVFTWPGSDPTLKPVLLAGHMDVVPIEAGTEAQWAHPPFGGDVADGFVWGRGSLDDKVTVLGLLEAVEALLAEGVQPRRTVVFAFGQDEEVGGWQGAARIAGALAARGLRFEYVLDEGLAVVEGMVPGVRSPVGLVGVAEKGAVSVVLTVDLEGGHSSMPAAETSIGVLAAAVRRIQGRPLPGRLDGLPAQTFAWLAPELGLGPRVALANLWLFGPLVKYALLAQPSTAALVRTTTAPTIFRAGVKQNVLPAHAEAVVNFRIRPGETIASVLDHVRRTVADPRVHLAAAPGADEPSPVSPADGFGFQTVIRSLKEVAPDVVVAPSLVLGGTDARHYATLAAGTYRFVPVRLKPGDLSRLHGTNERISVAGYGDAVRFYRRLLRNSAL